VSAAVSVCIPTYNYGRFLGQAIESVLAQTWGDFELIVSDNASTDDTQEVIAAFADERIRVHRNETNIGLFPNFSRCLELARGELVKFVCSDDWLDPRYLERTVPVMRAHPGVALLTTAGYVVDEAGRRFGVASAELGPGPVVRAADAIAAQARWLNLIGMPTSTLIRRDAAAAAGGFDPRFAPASDIHLWLKLLARGDLGWVPEPLVHVRVHASKGHDYGADPTESTFRSWEDAASWRGTPVTPPVLRTALYAEAERSLLYVGAHLAARRPGRALEILRLTGRHVSWWRVLPRFALNLPRLLRGQLARLRALRAGRMVVYGRGTRMGPPLPDPQA
jgi:glycosyltransferase involved in cell wall biosynthesis